MHFFIQQDAHEFLCSCLNLLEEEVLTFNKKQQLIAKQKCITADAPPTTLEEEPVTELATPQPDTPMVEAEVLERQSSEDKLVEETTAQETTAQQTTEPETTKLETLACPVSYYFDSTVEVTLLCPKCMHVTTMEELYRDFSLETNVRSK